MAAVSANEKKNPKPCSAGESLATMTILSRVMGSERGDGLLRSDQTPIWVASAELLLSHHALSQPGMGGSAQIKSNANLRFNEVFDILFQKCYRHFNFGRPSS